MDDDRLRGVYARFDVCKSCLHFQERQITPNAEIYGVSYFCNVEHLETGISLNIGGQHGKKASHLGAGRRYTNHLPVKCVFVLEQLMRNEAEE